jgi:predicted enzyme related to lactoylglutathione lyase
MSTHPIVHVEIPSRDPAVNAKFYGDAFGWKLENAPEFNYWQFMPASGPGGGFPGVEGQFEAKIGELLVYIGTDDIEASLAKIESLGGKTLSPKQEIPGTGWFAFFQDPSGNKVALYKSMNPAFNA